MSNGAVTLYGRSGTHMFAHVVARSCARACVPLQPTPPRLLRPDFSAAPARADVGYVPGMHSLDASIKLSRLVYSIIAIRILSAVSLKIFNQSTYQLIRRNKILQYTLMKVILLISHTVCSRELNAL